MSAPDDDVTAMLSDLVRTLQDLQTEVEPRTERGRPRPPTPEELLRFTSDVTIPAAILLLKTNIEALKLLRRALHIAEGRPAGRSEATAVRERATKLSQVTLSRLDDALQDLQGAIEGRPEDDEARELLEEAREIRADLAAAVEDGDIDEEGTDVQVDVDAELQSLKDDIDDIDDIDDGNGE
jgi:hypothetical protein